MENKGQNRRQFLTTGIASLIGSTAVVRPWKAALAAKKTSDSVNGPLIVTDVEKHKIHPNYVPWQQHQLNHFYGPRPRTIYVAHTNKGFYGLGEGRDEPQDVLDKYIGTSPFDWVGDELSKPMAKAMYDLMGKAARIPVYKLFGQRYRRWVPISSWTVSTRPDAMAQVVEKYSAMGYTWMKYHLSPFENVFDQLEAMERVAPRGFKLHFDLTHFGHNGQNPDLVERISHSPIAGCFEDPLEQMNDIESYIDLKKSIRLPILRHGSRIQHTFDVLKQSADGYIVGHLKLGVVIRRAGLFASTNVPFTVQWAGGGISRAMVSHMQSAFKTASLPFVTTSEIYASDVVKERLEPVNGFLRVSERPGLGVTLDREALEKLKQNRPPQQPPYILKTRFKNGTTMYNLMRPPETKNLMVLPNIWRLIPMSFDSPLATEYWDDDGSVQYKVMFKRLETETMVLEKK